MQVTIDSSEPLDKVLRVVGALYNVELAVPGRQQSPRAASGRRSRRGPAPSPAELRTWARANGFKVKQRGRVPAAVLAAYRENGASAK